MSRELPSREFPPSTSPVRRVAHALLGGALATVLAGVIDSCYAGAWTSPSGGGLALFFADTGVLVPLAYVVSLAVGVFLVFLDPNHAWSLGDVAYRAKQGDTAARGRTAALLLLLPPVTLGWLTYLAHVARRLLASPDLHKPVGAQLATSAVALAALAWLIVTALARVGGVFLARVGRRGASPLAWGAASLALTAALLAYGITQGTPAGTGGPLGIFGVLKRDELDLRAPALLLLLVTGAALLPGLIRRWFGVAAALLALLPLALTVQAASALNTKPRLAVALERDAPLGKVALRVLRRATDRDQDGFSASFGGGDCNDRDGRISPASVDIPGNSVDEDCSGADGQSIGSSNPGPAPTTTTAPGVTGATSATAVPAGKIPDNLNVLMITVDTLRADLGFAGYVNPAAAGGVSVSPNLDELAKKSSIYENAYSLASYTGKSVGPLLSGKYPSETHRGWSHFNSFSADDTMVAERLQTAGIRTVSVQGHWYFERFSGLGRGFDVLDMTAAPPPGAQAQSDSSITSDKLTDAAIRRLSAPENSGSRFFAWVHYLDPHADYLRHPETPDFGRTSLRGPYDHEVAFTDKHIGRLLDWLAAQPFADRTVVIVTSDHGEAFGEHKMIRHGFEIWEELVRVPLLVAIPGVPPRRIATRRGSIDLVPTLLDLFHVTPSFDRSPSDFVSGVSLLPDLFAKDQPPERDVFVDMAAGPNNEERRALIHESRKLYVSGGVRYQLFDLATDPGEHNDLADTDKVALTEMRARYDEFRRHLREVRVRPVPKE